MNAALIPGSLPSSDAVKDGLEVPTGHLLLVDDVPTNLLLLSRILTRHGYQVQVANDGPTALQAIRQSTPDLVLLDVCMPNMDGFEVCAILKADEGTRQIPVLFVSALDELVDKIKAFKLGGADYITKPFQAGEVLARVQQQLQIAHLQRQLHQQNQQLQQANAQLRQEIQARQEVEAQLRRANEHLERLANLDGLTLIANRRCFEETLQREWQRHQQTDGTLALILADVDQFKPYNDHYGHPAGDECLRQVARILYRTVRQPEDLVARYGGEEFVLILPDTDVAGALRVVERIQAELHSLHLPHAYSSASDRVTFSLGIVSCVPANGGSMAQLIAQADQALYAAKRQGRNRCVVQTADLPG